MAEGRGEGAERRDGGTGGRGAAEGPGGVDGGTEGSRNGRGEGEGRGAGGGGGAVRGFEKRRGFSKRYIYCAASQLVLHAVVYCPPLLTHRKPPRNWGSSCRGTRCQHCVCVESLRAWHYTSNQQISCGSRRRRRTAHDMTLPSRVPLRRYSSTTGVKLTNVVT